jgi:hypothetical protein
MASASRDDILELLPWHENATLDAQESEAVRALLASDLEANRQARELRALHAVVADEPILAPTMALNLRRLTAQLDPAPRARPAWFVPLALAATAVLAITVGFGLFMAGERAGRFHTLTTPAALPQVSADAVMLRVTVADGVDAAQLARLVDAPGARVLQGPSAHGVALVAVPAADATRVLARLQADPRLRFVTAEPR